VVDADRELARTRLSRVAAALDKSLRTIEAPAPPSADEQAAKLGALVTAAQAERKALALRRAVVARRRELSQELSARKEQEEASRRAEAARKRKAEEERRAQDDARRKAQEHTQRELQSIREAEVRTLAKNLQDRGIMKVAIDVRALVVIQTWSAAEHPHRT
jgi:translation initiation factor 3 subunit A